MPDPSIIQVISKQIDISGVLLFCILCSGILKYINLKLRKTIYFEILAWWSLFSPHYKHEPCNSTTALSEKQTITCVAAGWVGAGWGGAGWVGAGWGATGWAEEYTKWDA